MNSFEKISKEEFVNELKWHREQDLVVQGKYGNKGDEFKGCHMGCSANSISRLKGIDIATDDNYEIAQFLGIPHWLTEIFERVFENLPENKSSDWLVDSAMAIPSRVQDFKPALDNILIWIIESTLDKHEDEKIKTISKELVAAIKINDREKILDLRSAAYTYAANAAGAAGAAATNAAGAYAAYDAAYAAYDAAYAAGAAGAASTDAYADAKKEFYTELAKVIIEELKKLKTNEGE